MADSVRRQPSSAPAPSMDDVRPRMATAVLPGPSNRLAWSAVLKDALDRHYGSLKAAAYAMGEYDPSQLTRDLDTGKFKQERLELCDDAAKGAIARALHEAFGRSDPKARTKRLIRKIRRDLDELDELAEAVA